MEIEKKCHQVFANESLDNSMEFCEKYIREYPNNLFLKLRIGYLYMMSLMRAKDEDEIKLMVNKAIEHFERASTSSDQEIRESAKTMLSSSYITIKEFDKAEEVLLSIPKALVDRDEIGRAHV